MWSMQSTRALESSRLINRLISGLLYDSRKTFGGNSGRSILPSTGKWRIWAGCLMDSSMVRSGGVLCVRSMNALTGKLSRTPGQPRSWASCLIFFRPLTSHIDGFQDSRTPFGLPRSIETPQPWDTGSKCSVCDTPAIGYTVKMHCL